ncbi:MAG: DHHW family protein [Clostridia bacterium]|nr:DHHW family protein [Clostridia bacterium]
MSVKGFDQKQVPIAIASLVVVVAIMVCILVFGKTTSIPTLETTTESSKEEQTTEESTTKETTTEYTRATTQAQEFKNTGAIIVQGNRAMEIFGKNENGLKRYAGYISTFAEKVPNVTVYMMLAPTSIEFYGPEEYHTGDRSQKKGMEVAYAAVTAKNVKTVNIYKELERYVDEEYVYFRTDHHWTARGAYHAYVAFSKVAGFDSIPLEGRKTGKFDTFVGTLYAWSGASILKENPDYLEYFYPVTETTAYRYPNGYIRDEEAIPMQVINENPPSGKYTCFIEGDNPVTKISTNAGTGRKIVVIKESYGNSFAPYLCDHYDEVWVIDPRKVNESANEIDLASFVNKYGITDVMFLNYMFAATSPQYIDPFNKLLGT